MALDLKAYIDTQLAAETRHVYENIVAQLIEKDITVEKLVSDFRLQLDQIRLEITELEKTVEYLKQDLVELCERDQHMKHIYDGLVL